MPPRCREASQNNNRGEGVLRQGRPLNPLGQLRYAHTKGFPDSRKGFQTRITNAILQPGYETVSKAGGASEIALGPILGFPELLNLQP